MTDVMTVLLKDKGWFCVRCESVKIGEDEPLKVPGSRLSPCNTVDVGSWGHQWQPVIIEIRADAR